MSLAQPGAESVASPGPASASKAEQSVKSNVTSRSASTRAPKPRSCLVCRSRKVRCDKQSPCSNCRRANISCVLPSFDRPPRWARRFERPAWDEVMDRIHHLESLVESLSGQLEQANAATKSTGASYTSPASSTPDERDVSQYGADASPESSSALQKQFGRLVLQDASRSRYVGNGFWSRINDELDTLKLDARNLATDDSGLSDNDESSFGNTPSTHEYDRAPPERHGFLFKHNLSSLSSDLRDFHPLPSQIPFFLDVFGENVNAVAQVIHLPTVTKMIRELRGDMTKLTPANEALMFSIYYAAVTSMEEEDVNVNFGATKAELNFKYRLGVEQALAKADFLNVPDLTLLQAFVIFLLLLRRHDSPRFVWMMTGLAIRMGLALGLHRDGSNFGHLTPFEVEMRRRAWWILCVIDVRASEDQGADYTIALGSFDTKLPLNINNSDIEPDTREIPREREGLTDMSFIRISIITSNATKKMLAHGSNMPSRGEQNRLVNEIHERLERDYLQYSTESNIAYWLAVTLTRLVMAKMTLLVYMPVLFSADEQLSEELRSKLLVAAIETAEYNNALNSEQACRHWRWLFQSYTHWYAIVFMLIEIHRRPWSPIIERAWVALHSVWLIPPQTHTNKDLHIWFPLRKLMAKARKHRQSEIEQLQNNPDAVRALEAKDSMMPSPASPGPFPPGSNSTALFLERWNQLVVRQNTLVITPYMYGDDEAAINASISTLEPAYAPSSSTAPTDYSFSVTAPTNSEPTQPSDFGNQPAWTQSAYPKMHLDQQVRQPGNMDAIPWLWPDDGLSNTTALDHIDMNMDLGGNDVDWYNWVESAREAIG